MFNVAENGLHQDLAQAGPAVEFMAQTLARVAQNVETDAQTTDHYYQEKYTARKGFSIQFGASITQHCTGTGI